MATPYLSTRNGSSQWLMQRVSAALLLVMAGVHFSLQHFTSDAVSTGLTVAARLNNPYWQAYYVVFIVLALYHGVNGVIGIIQDYNPNRHLRIKLEWGLWTLAVLFAALGVKNIVSPVPLGMVKEGYAARGFAVGDSKGNPPTSAIHYDFRDELRELSMLEYYLGHHVHRSESSAMYEVFGPGESLAGLDAAATKAAVAKSGEAFDRWLRGVIAKGPVKPEERDRHAAFSSTYEFAVWAANVRATDAHWRGDDAVAARWTGDPQSGYLPYRANDLH